MIDLDLLLAEFIRIGYFRVKVLPGARQTEMVGLLDDQTLKINISAKPEGGKANRELLKFFKKKFKLDLEIISGKTSRIKLLKILNA